MQIVSFTKRGDELVFSSPKDKILYNEFVKSAKEGQVVEVFMDMVKSKATASQIAKIHACIRELAKESGFSFEEVKYYIKKKAGLILSTEEGETCKSFKDVSRDEILLCLEVAKEMGLNYNLYF